MKNRKTYNLTLGKCRVASLNEISMLKGGDDGEPTNTFTGSKDVKICTITYTCKDCPPVLDSKDGKCLLTDDC